MKLEWVGIGEPPNRVLYLTVASMLHDGEQYRDGDGLPLGPNWKDATKALEDRARKAAK